MAATKSAFTALVSQSLAGGASVNTAEWNLSAAYAGRLFVKLTNGATPPTATPTVTFYEGEASGIKRVLYVASGDMIANSVNHPNAVYGLEDMYANAMITNSGTVAIMVEAYGSAATGI